jgi:membrane-associated protein
MLHWLHQLLDPQGIQQIIASGGLAVLVAIIFAETGLLVGFFLPGDSLLFLAGTMCSVNLLDPSLPPPLDALGTSCALVAAAVAGNSLNYLLGRIIGQRAWSRADGRLVTRARLEQAHEFYERHGVLSLVLTRFVPVARTFVPFVAGISRMSFTGFCLWNLIGAVVWVPSLITAGYHLGRVALVQRHIELIVLAVIVVSLLPVAISALARMRRARVVLTPAPSPPAAGPGSQP